MGLDIKNFYLGTPLDRFEYTKIPITLFPAHVWHHYQQYGESVKIYIRLL